jgi:hypothetical protein
VNGLAASEPALVDVVEVCGAPGVGLGVVLGVLGGVLGVEICARNVRIGPNANAAVDIATRSRRFMFYPLPSSLPRPMEGTLAADASVRPACDVDHTRR